MMSFRFSAIVAGLAVAVTVQAETPAASEAAQSAASPDQELPHSFFDPVTFVGESILHPKDPYQIVPGKDQRTGGRW